MILVDANLLIYVVNRDDPRHSKARRWWESVLSGTKVVGIPWVAASAFVRITTRAGLMPQPLTIEQACDYVSDWLDQPHVSRVVPGVGHWAVLSALLRTSGAAGNLVTDAHIAALAIENGATVASADRDFGRFEQVPSLNPIG